MVEIDTGFSGTINITVVNGHVIVRDNYTTYISVVMIDSYEIEKYETGDGKLQMAFTFKKCNQKVFDRFVYIKDEETREKAIQDLENIIFVKIAEEQGKLLKNDRS